ncbi:hypothetical protein ACFQH6_13595 [Halobacteriaceae archaeon GCM10025711]
MEQCPYCGSDLIGSTNVQPRRPDGDLGSKTTGAELVTCPDCGNVIDGFTSH